MIGSRVKLAREACRLTQQELAYAASITQAAVSEIEAGRIVSPSDDVIAAIARATQFPARFFQLGALPDFPEGNYRRLASGSVKTGRQVRAQARHVLEVVQRSEAALRLPPIAIEPIRDPLSMEALEKLAIDTRGVLGIGPGDPIPNLMRAVERAGVVVVRLPGEMKGHDGFSVWPEPAFDGRPIIVLTAGHPGDRDRFSVAHELAHLILHTARPGVGAKQAEAEANRLAGALLLPRRVALEALRPPVTLRVLMDVKAAYGISMAAGAKRAFDLSIIGSATLQSIHKQLAARRWKKQEPVEVASEKPVLICKIIEALGGGGSTVQRAERLSMAVFTLRALEAA